MRKPLALCFSLLVLCAALTGCTLHQGSASAASAASTSAASEGPTLRLGVCLPQDDPVSDLIYTIFFITSAYIISRAIKNKPL